MQNLDLDTLISALDAARLWLSAKLFAPLVLVQLAAVLVAFGLARLVAPWLERAIGVVAGRLRFRASVVAALCSVAMPLAWLIAVWLAEWTCDYAGWPSDVPRVAASLIGLWIVIRLTSRLVRDPTWSRAIAVVAWTIAALNILGLMPATTGFLDSIAVSLGGVRISALTVIRGIIALAVLLWLATGLSRLLERRIVNLPSLTPSFQVLVVKLLKIVLVTVAVVAALGSVGIDLTAFAIFSGAIGLGIGFGLQKSVSNLVSGIILLLDRSIKPGDVIALGDTYGSIKSLGARYVSVITRDYTEHLIPNEELITQRVENWSYSSDLVRLHIPLGVAYQADVRQAIMLAIDAAKSVTRVQESPAPACLLTGFGASSVDLDLRFWIADPSAGIANVKSEILLAIWDRFHEHGIEIPFPQSDLHLRSSDPLPVRLEPAVAQPRRAARSG